MKRFKPLVCCLALAGVFVHGHGATAGPAPGAGPDTCMDQAQTQSQMNACAQQAFEAATADYSAAYRQLSQSVGNKQRQLLRQVQTEWMQYRVKACEFERNGVAGGSAAPMVFALCQARITRERTAELQRHLHCEEGDLSCVRPSR